MVISSLAFLSASLPPWRLPLRVVPRFSHSFPQSRRLVFRELYEEVIAGESTLLVDESGFAVRLLRVTPC